MPRSTTPRTSAKSSPVPAPVRVPTARRRQRPTIGAEEIARLAYELYEARGRRDGEHTDDWLRAEQQLTALSTMPVDVALAPTASRKKRPAPRV